MSGGGGGGSAASKIGLDFNNVDIKSNSTINATTMSGVNASLRGSKDAPIAVMVLGDPTKPVAVKAEAEMDMDMDVDATVGMNASVTGAKDAPVTMMMLGDQSQPISLKGDVDMDMDMDASVGMNASVTGAKDAPVTMMMLGDQTQPISGHVTGDKEKPMALAMEMTNLPRFTVEDLKELTTPKLRLSLPGHQQVAFKFLGRELFSVCMGGEQQLIAQEYVKTDGEDCNIPVCDVDVRPFPNPK